MTKSPARVDLRQLVKLRKTVESDLSGAGNGVVRRAFRGWVKKFKEFTRQRYERFSAGGGDWDPLKNPWRRKRGKKVPALILRDSGTLYRATLPGSRGFTETFVRRGEWEVGYGGTQVHPYAGMRIADLAEIHALGTSTVPARKIVVDPPGALVRELAADMKRAMLEAHAN